MFGPASGLLAVLAVSASVVQGQAVWASNQVNTTICEWEQFRAHVVRDTVYMDGGGLWWLPGLSDGSYATPESDRNPLGIVFTLNFSTPFATTDNITAVFGTLSKVAAGTAAKNLAPNYLDGAMLGNDDEWFLYGGMLRQTKEFSEPSETNVLAYQKYQYGVQKDGFLPGFVYDDLPKGMTRYLAYGGAAAAPSENKAWYFSGMHAPGWGPIYEPGANASLTAINVSSTLITLDMTTQQQESWKNETLPSDTPGRANPELVWVPVGEQGILVAIGGVIFPDFTGFTGKSSNEAESKATSPSFMSTIDVYDVASGKWYRQPTSGGSPGQLTRGCAVVAPAQDSSSFNIYHYGGYSGLSQSEPFNDDVWVLSLPSFTWTKLASGSTSGRAGHKCFMPYPDQMFVIGGYTTRTGSSLTCLRETIRVFNLTSGTWLSRYDPAKWSKYAVPDAVVSKIGGSPTGGATATTPAPSGWSDAALGNVFATKYPSTKIATYYPYQSASPANNTNPNVPSETTSSSGGGVPSFLPPVLGVVLGLVFLTMVAVLILLWRRRRLFRARGGMSEAGTEDTNGHRILSWMRGHPGGDKALTVTTSDETPSSPEDIERSSTLPTHAPSMAEMMNTEVRAPVELMDTSPRPELHDTGLSHIDVMNRYSRLASGASLNNGSHYTTSGTQQIDHASVAPSPSSASVATSGAAARASASARHASSELAGDTPPPAPAPPPVSPAVAGAGARGYIPSGVSNISERDRAHLRTISDTTVSSVATGAQVGGDVGAGAVSSPSPPTGDGGIGGGGGDYISAKGRGEGQQIQGAGEKKAGEQSTEEPQGQRRAGGANHSPTQVLRRSVFHESREDMTDEKGKSS
ncbi:hypothetical protein QBC47DRAFT_433058 [Echria macrotheca]|uniref:Kelch repeat protein n=1 Tax=Echria macrotheca TaxID=438768 RepID=A0AAJ0B7E0_9PEZI|nr:hypothetical protein QBC47DRAFT_433058 [Echria macrotheca]